MLNPLETRTWAISWRDGGFGLPVLWQVPGMRGRLASKARVSPNCVPKAGAPAAGNLVVAGPADSPEGGPPANPWKVP